MIALTRVRKYVRNGTSEPDVYGTDGLVYNADSVG